MTNPFESKMREMYGDDVVNIIHNAFARLGIPTNPKADEATVENAKKVMLLFSIQRAVMQGHQLDIPSEEILLILRELVTINESIFAGAKKQAETINKAQYN